MSGVVAVDAVGYRYEPSRSIVNSGPYPPKGEPNDDLYHPLARDGLLDRCERRNRFRISSKRRDMHGENNEQCGCAPVCNAGTGQIT